MISEKQLAANRRNAQRSTGPRSAAGKQRVRLNGLRHGLAGQCNILPTEDPAAHDRFCARIVAYLHPQGQLQQQLAQAIAEDNWRLHRVAALENNLFALGPPLSVTDDPDLNAALAVARTFHDNSAQFALLSVYEQRIHRTLHKNATQLGDLQTAAQNGFGFANRSESQKISSPSPPSCIY